MTILCNVYVSNNIHVKREVNPCSTYFLSLARTVYKQTDNNSVKTNYIFDFDIDCRLRHAPSILLICFLSYGIASEATGRS